MINIYYFHPLNLSFKSAQTIQVLRDYLYLSKKEGIKEVFLYGLYDSQEDLNDIVTYISDNKINLKYKRNSRVNKIIIKLQFLFNIITNKQKKVIVTRTLNKTIEVLRLKSFISNVKFIQEFHEEAFPHLIKANKRNLKAKFEYLIKKLDGVIFTNISQKVLFDEEFSNVLTNHIILPNGVEIEKFSKAKKNTDNKFYITYLGQFNKWKNVSLIFEAFGLLDDERFVLRIAGGKNDTKSKEYIENNINKYNIDKSKVEFLGFVKNDQVVEKVLNNSSILLLPLGDNIQSKYLTSPMKLFEYMATSIPILSINYPSINLIVSENEIYFSNNCSKDFAQKIQNIIYDKEQVKKIQNMNNLVKEYSYENRSKKYETFLKGLF